MAALKSVVVRSYMRTGSCPSGMLVSEETLAPLTPEERQSGKSDKLKAWYDAHGSVRPVRHEPTPPSADSYEAEEKEEQHADLPEETQLMIWEMMQPRISFLVRAMVSQGYVAVCDKPYMEGVLFDHCRDAYPDWKPEESSLKTFLYNVLEKRRVDNLRRMNAKKRKGDFTALHLVPYLASEEEAVSEGQMSEELLADPRSIRGMEFNWAWQDLEDMCTWQEKLTLHRLYCGYTAEDTAKALGMNTSKFRRSVLGPLQLKADAVGFTPVTGKFILK